jgi:wobble nucleotide-excising tRNase
MKLRHITTDEFTAMQAKVENMNVKGHVEEWEMRCLLAEAKLETFSQQLVEQKAKAAARRQNCIDYYDEEIAKRDARIAELEKDQHTPTVTYWMNMATQFQQEAKQRFDDWFVVQQRVEELERQLAAANNMRQP